MAKKRTRRSRKNDPDPFLHTQQMMGNMTNVMIGAAGLGLTAGVVNTLLKK